MDKQSERYNAYVNGPILFTAPHSKQLVRNAKKKQVHLKESYTAWIATCLALREGRNSFIAWNDKEKTQVEDLDPNYLTKNTMRDSPFHQMFHCWAAKNEKHPVFHIDIHGKKNKEKDCEIDIGSKSLTQRWGKTALRKNLINFFEEEANQIFKGVTFREFPCKFNARSPAFSGFWGNHHFTMTQQAVNLGIPSIQVQIPLEVREALFKDEQLMKKFILVFKICYEKIVVPWLSHHEHIEHDDKVSKKVAEDFKDNLISQQKVKELSKKVKV